jgi:formylglycine-generating enzyme required for sulfatase activity
MPRWFLSYHSPDQALAERLRAAIERKDAASRVFFAPQHNRAGGFWTAQLAQEIANATAFILLVGERGLGPWQVLEYDEALDKRVKSCDFPLVMVLLEGQAAPGLPFLRRLHWIVSPEPDSEKGIARLFDATSGNETRPGELWRHASPYRGLSAMEEKDSDYFFGREQETVEVLNMLAAAPDRLPLLIGNSGVGKSSLAKAGVLAALKRQAWPEGAGETKEWPDGFASSRRWCFLTVRPGANPMQALVEPFLHTWQFEATDPRRETRRTEWIENLREGRNTLSGLLTATEARLEELGQPKPRGFFLYIDQGEELYTRAQPGTHRRFSEIVSEGLNDPRLQGMMSLRADFFGDFQNDEPLCGVHAQINVLPLREVQLRNVVSRPAALLAARFETDNLAGDIAKRTAEESTEDAGALPLLSYLLEDIWQRMVERGDGVLRLPAQSIDLGRVLVERASAFLRSHPCSENDLRRIFTLKLATVREDGEPTRRRAFRPEFSDEEWRLVSGLADHPYRLLTTGARAASVVPSSRRLIAADAKVATDRNVGTDSNAAPQAAETYAEVAHEAIFRRWDKLRQWIDTEREFLAWRSGLEVARHTWQMAPDDSKNDALLMGLALAQAQSWRSKRGGDLPSLDNEFVGLSVKRDLAVRNRTSHMRAALLMLALAIVAGLAFEAWSKNREYLKINSEMLIDQIRPRVLVASVTGALEPKTVFKECSYCPEMVVIPPGRFEMGASEREKIGASEREKKDESEFPRHTVTIDYPFAVSRYQVTFREWDACFARSGCDYSPGDQNWGRSRQPILNVDWFHAKQYTDWLSKETGKPYMLLSEAEYEYAARARSETLFPWGNEIGINNANCDGCGSPWDDKRTAPAGSFNPNAFGLYEMIGNLYSWVDDCWHETYDGRPPTDGSSWTTACSEVAVATSATTKRYSVVRGGSYISYPRNLRSAARRGYSPQYTVSYIGFRVKRALVP